MVRFGFLGTEGPLARATLSALLETGAVPDVVIALGLATVVAPASAQPPFAIAAQTSIVSLAADADVAVLHCPTDEAAIAALLDTLPVKPQLMVVACLPIILQPSTFAATRHGFINVHPSLLPQFRGPQPAFWQLRAGLAQGGVSVHQMDAGIDTGEILLQSAFDLEPGVTEQTLDTRAGAAAGALLASNLAHWPPDSKTRARPGLASYRGVPNASAFAIDARSWSAMRAYRFIRGTAWRGVAFEVTGDGWVARVNQALEVRTDLPRGPVQIEGQTCTLPFADACLVARGDVRTAR